MGRYLLEPPETLSYDGRIPMIICFAIPRDAALFSFPKLFGAIRLLLGLRFF